MSSVDAVVRGATAGDRPQGRVLALSHRGRRAAGAPRDRRPDPFATSEQTSSNTGGTTVTRNVEILDTGVVLPITPRIHANNAVDLTIVQSVSTPSSKDGTNLTPVVATRDISSQILAQSGRTLLAAP